MLVGSGSQLSFNVRHTEKSSLTIDDRKQRVEDDDAQGFATEAARQSNQSHRRKVGRAMFTPNIETRLYSSYALLRTTETNFG